MDESSPPARSAHRHRFRNVFTRCVSSAVKTQVPVVGCPGYSSQRMILYRGGCGAGGVESQEVGEVCRFHPESGDSNYAVEQKRQRKELRVRKRR